MTNEERNQKGREITKKSGDIMANVIANTQNKDYNFVDLLLTIGGWISAFSIGAATQYYVHVKHLKNEANKAIPVIESLSKQMDELKNEGATNEQTE